MFTPGTPQQDYRQLEQVNHEKGERLKSAAARRAQLGTQGLKLHERIRHWFRWLTQR